MFIDDGSTGEAISGSGRLRLFADSDKAEQLQFVRETAGDITIDQPDVGSQVDFASGRYEFDPTVCKIAAAWAEFMNGENETTGLQITPIPH